MANASAYEKINHPPYRIDEIDAARERIASRHEDKLKLVREISKAKTQLYMLEQEDVADRYLIRELSRSPYSSLKSYFREEARHQPSVSN